MTGCDKFGRAEARTRDAADPLRDLRDRFVLPSDVIYLDGNSLGAMPATAERVLADVVARQWGRDLIRSWNDNDWIGAPQRVGEKIASLIGAEPNEVIVADSVSVNIFKLLSAILGCTRGRAKILSETNSFPTDAHVAHGVADVLGMELHLAPREDLLAALTEDVAVLLLSHVHYKSGQRFDMSEINAAARTLDVPVVWDLSHSAGACPLDLKRDGAQYAVGCGYKYLNGGPGAPAFLYVGTEQQVKMRSPLQGWMGHASPFAFDDVYDPAPGMGRFLVGTPPILSLLALECGVDEFAGLDMHVLWQKSRTLFEFLAEQMTEHCPLMRLVTPTDSDLRGSHVSFSCSDAWPINNALIARGVIGDFRTPDVLRFGLAPLYTSFEDLSRAVEVLADIIATNEWRKPQYSRESRVT